MVVGSVWDDWNIAFGRNFYLGSGNSWKIFRRRKSFWWFRILYDGNWVFHRLLHSCGNFASTLLPDEPDLDLHLFGKTFQCGGA